MCACLAVRRVRVESRSVSVKTDRGDGAKDCKCGVVRDLDDGVMVGFGVLDGFEYVSVLAWA